MYWFAVVAVTGDRTLKCQWLEVPCGPSWATSRHRQGCVLLVLGEDSFPRCPQPGGAACRSRLVAPSSVLQAARTGQVPLRSRLSGSLSPVSHVLWLSYLPAPVRFHQGHLGHPGKPPPLGPALSQLSGTSVPLSGVPVTAPGPGAWASLGTVTLPTTAFLNVQRWPPSASGVFSAVTSAVTQTSAFLLHGQKTPHLLPSFYTPVASSRTGP